MSEIKTGEYEILHTGIFHAIEDEETILSIRGIKIIISFEKKEGAERAAEFESTDGTSARLKLVNAHGPLGFGNTRPFKIGEADGKNIYLTFRTRSLDDAYLRTFEYTLYAK